MKVAKANARAASPPKERNEMQFLLESMEEVHEKLDGLEWGAEVPAQVARELAKINDTLDWRCLHVLEQRLARMEAALERIERRLHEAPHQNTQRRPTPTDDSEFVGAG